MIGAYLFGRRLAPVALGLATILAVGCQDQLPTGVGADGAVALRVTASVVGTPIATLVVTVTASDISVPLVFNLTVANGTASGTIRVPPGVSRTIAATAMDDQGNVTHDGSVTCDVRPGPNPTVVLHLTPRSGQVPITITFGSYGVVVTPAAPSIAVGAQVQLAAVVTDAYGTAIANPAVAWATSQPTMATVSASGLVTGVAVGTATIVATYEGVAALSTITVTGVGGGFFASVQAGYYHTCGLTPSGVAYCWGENDIGQLGDGSTTQRLAPVAVGGGLTFASLSAGEKHTCGVTPTGVAYCWGWNGDGQLGDGTTTNRLLPLPVAGGLTFASLSAASTHTCGLTPAGAAYCWGYNGEGELGDGTTADRLTPVAVAGDLTFASLTAANPYTCGLTRTGVAWCWGNNNYGQLGDGTTTERDSPVAVGGGLPTFASFTAGPFHTCGLTPAGVAYCWGFNGYGLLGDGTTTTRLTAVPVAGGSIFGSLRAGLYHTCGLTPAGAAYCWGNNANGQLGNGDARGTSMLTPVAVVGGLTFASLSSQGQHTCGLTLTSVAYCWGDNVTGQLGDGTTTDRRAPVAVMTP